MNENGRKEWAEYQVSNETAVQHAERIANGRGRITERDLAETHGGVRGFVYVKIENRFTGDWIEFQHNRMYIEYYLANIRGMRFARDRGASTSEVNGLLDRNFPH